MKIQLIENYLQSHQTKAKVFHAILKRNRQEILSLFEVWQLTGSSNKLIRNQIIELFNICSYSDPVLLRLLYENTNFPSELLCSIKQDIELLGIFRFFSLFQIIIHDKYNYRPLQSC